MPFNNYQIEAEDVEYLRHGSKSLLARVFKPRGTGPFPALIDVHGGAWNLSDRLADTTINEALAKSGVVVAALDFRMPPEASYPASMTDINYGIRWLKAHAIELGSRPELVGIAGSSSGGHQAILAAMRPHDPRYAAIPLPAGAPAVDASVRCAIMYWPVIDPLGRYHYAQKLKAGGRPYPEIADLVLPLHDKYWKTEAAMAEGSPLRILERGEKVHTPPAQYIQGTNDVAHPREHLDQFVASYRKAGGHVELELFEGMAEGFIIRKPDSPASAKAIEKIIAFVHEQVR
ncbi:MAG: alpha/beta hydrolase [Deltaproteobacteria bacterium]|nr:alpha/beta hydrolase [Deltaproteobacteria bacterium]